jgi:putative ATPase
MQEGTLPMARDETMSLFDLSDNEELPAGPDAPLAERMRPLTTDELVGQEQLVGYGRLVRWLIDGEGPPALLDPLGWAGGGPGTGKTTLARLLACLQSCPVTGSASSRLSNPGLPPGSMLI